MLLRVFITMTVALTTLFFFTVLKASENNMSNYYTENEFVLNGRLLTYFLPAYLEFAKAQSKLEDFEVLIFETDTEVRITFVPNLAPGEQISLGGRTSLGQSVSYYVSKTEHKVTRWHFHK